MKDAVTNQTYRWRWKAMRLQEEVEKLQAETGSLRAVEKSMKESLSWKITAPLRWIDAALRPSRRSNGAGSSAGPSFDWTQRIPVRRRRGRILADCSMTVRGKSSPGMRRVTTGVIKGAMSAGVAIEPVDLLGNGLHAASDFFATGGTHAPELGLADCEAFLLLDASWGYVGSLDPFLRSLRDGGIPIYALIHDTVPLDHPELCLEETVKSFGGWLDHVFRLCDGAICVSETTADRVRHHLQRRCPQRREHFSVSAWLPGNEAWEGEPAAGELVPDGDFILSVGTIEPRKNHRLLLQAMTELWSEELPSCRLVVFGERGWGTDELVKSIENHPEWGEKLWWFDGGTDNHLHALYHACRAVALPSIEEGFSQPLSEAAALRKPVVLSDLPVFRERVVSGGYFFAPSDLESLKSALRSALRPGAVPVELRRTSWEKSAGSLADLIAPKA